MRIEAAVPQGLRDKITVWRAEKAAEDWQQEINNWHDLLEKKHKEADDHHFSARFAPSFTALQGTYYTLVKDGNTMVLFADIDKKTGSGRRKAVVYGANELHLLETGNPVDKNGDPYPNYWVEVLERKKLVTRLKDTRKHFKGTKLFDPYSGASWRGYYPSVDDVYQGLKRNEQ